MASVTHTCAGTAPASTGDDAARLNALALAALAEHGQADAELASVDELVAEAARASAAALARI